MAMQMAMSLVHLSDELRATQTAMRLEIDSGQLMEKSSGHQTELRMAMSLVCSSVVQTAMSSVHLSGELRAMQTAMRMESDSVQLMESDSGHLTEKMMDLSLDHLSAALMVT